MTKRKIDPDSAVTVSSGNVFTDLGFAPGEAAVLGIGQSRVSDLVRGKWDKFSLDMLITLAARAGKRVELALI